MLKKIRAFVFIFKDLCKVKTKWLSRVGRVEQLISCAKNYLMGLSIECILFKSTFTILKSIGFLNLKNLYYLFYFYIKKNPKLSFNQITEIHSQSWAPRDVPPDRAWPTVRHGIAVHCATVLGVVESLRLVCSSAGRSDQTESEYRTWCQPRPGTLRPTPSPLGWCTPSGTVRSAWAPRSAALCSGSRLWGQLKVHNWSYI